MAVDKLKELSIEAGNRAFLTNIERAKFARGGVGLDSRELTALQEGRIGARLEDKRESLFRARQIRIEEQRQKEQERANRATEKNQERLAQIEQQRADQAKATADAMAREERKARKAAEPTIISSIFSK